MLTNVESVEKLRKIATEKNRPYLTKRVKPASVEEAEAHGWSVDKRYKHDIQVKKQKPYGIEVRDHIWSILYKMDFLYMNGKEAAQLLPDGKTPLRQNVEINVVGIDREVGVAVFLKSSPEKREADERFRQELELYAQARSAFSININQAYKPSDQPKLKPTFIIFACNITINEADKNFAKEKNIVLFDENDLEYYRELVEQLGAAAKYQFLADVLENAEIPGLNISLPAIRIKMHKITYYSFAIQPEYLLKIAYIAHRKRGEKADLHAYQRMVEKERLAKLREYIDRPAMFPTNIVMSFKKKQRFEEIKVPAASIQYGELGVLRLSNMSYKSAWIIDGQHRLYAYSGHPRASDSLLSVLAFEDLPPNMQAEFFIDINSKQKRVKQALLQELFNEVHKDAPDPADRMKSLISQAILSLSDSDHASPFYQRILNSEEGKTNKKCITWRTMFNALSDGIFTGSEHGVFWVKYNNDATKERIVYITEQWFTAIKKDIPSWWDLGSATGGGLAMNDSVAACFIVLKSVFQHLTFKGYNLTVLSNEQLAKLFLPYAVIVSKHLASLSKEERQAFRDYGRGIQGQTQRARTLQIAIHKAVPEYMPTTLKDYLQEQEKGNTKELLMNILTILRDFVTGELQNQFGQDEQQWWQEGIPLHVKQAAQQRYERDKGKQGSKEHYLDCNDYKTIIQANWDLFQASFSNHDYPNYTDGRLSWLEKINEIQILITQGKKVTPEQLDELNRYNEWLQQNFLLH